MSHTIQNQKALLTRVRRIRGQLAALEESLLRADECGAVLQQVAAVRGAVGGLMSTLLEGHLREHVAAPELSAEARAEEAERLVAALRTYLR